MRLELYSRGKAVKAHRVESEEKYEHVKSSQTVRPKLDLNVLLKRIKEQKKDDKKVNLLILSGALSVAVVTFLILSL